MIVLVPTLVLCILLCLIVADNTTEIITTSNNSSELVLKSILVDTNVSITTSRLSSHTCGIKRDASDLSNNGTSVNRPLRILISVSNAYIRPLLNWLIFYHNICPDTSLLYIVCLDKDIELTLPKYGLSCARSIHVSNSAGHIWLWRARVVKDLLTSKYDVLMSDTDAIWLRNPFVALESFPHSDIIASRGLFPETISRELGACICMGFIYVKSSANSVLLWNDLLLRMQESKGGFKDDQLEFNNLLLQSKLQYKGGRAYVNVTHNTIPNTGKFQLQLSKPMTITLLPQNQFMRECSGKNVKVYDSTVAHCVAVHKTGTSKESALGRYGLFSLLKTWQEVPVTRFDEYLSRITEPGSIASVFRGS